jgi:peptidylprolyl isomerase
MRQRLWQYVGLFCCLFFFSAHGKEQKNPIVVLETTQGNIEIEMLLHIAPKACENFLNLIEEGYYKETIFHRVIKGFMIQGGDPTGKGTGGKSIWGHPFADEFSSDVLFDGPGILAMANRGPNTNTSQFFITTNHTPWLNYRHTIFGKVVHGMDVVQKIEVSTTDPTDRPMDDQVIFNIYIKP